MRYGYPFAMLRLGAGEPVDVVPARLRDWWRVALAVELAGTMTAALDVTVDYVRERQQFGRPIGSFQALQHRLAECAVGARAARWMALEAAWLGAPPEAAAAALSYALVAADRIFADTHQCTGAIGFTTEYDLHLWTMRIPSLKAEAELLGSPGAAVAAERWGKVAS
jgi:alkylation response protein AidB-like acyl-CoA dehydrogenase